MRGRGNAVFLGENGSGKSVLLDAIQIVMTGNRASAIGLKYICDRLSHD
jgi:DNA repair ATPase RecN